ncbi:hypothetical protein BASA50_005458 [Batrachochytrium salamandrivorans]|uniref:Uncharacterized protein n=1 Tax=Batrachochytrium salamandrivorans TaxID=1357716 RepID=A0ABQ8FCP1_9FUNG|nr:hypothetical protein BASA60_009210 [Batrachochytrium salamandrivorans]KAH6567156.1 hypothetical protein BASA62_006253 [Batrachochytrium salamandrivorans]KAH6595985.1 hypothetical protein BASA50_005458 [Batrachochytrium salamandrivorans]KAH6602668.1 hypothetical protein BASA61_000895 [Batrachochytrium salamandrivorans]KAH9245854.1 hypothetical protein BASA81_016633 [Batrachochytrium salamandrivorans]
MRVNVLVAAAMVITCVNASGRGRPRGYSRDHDAGLGSVSSPPELSENDGGPLQESGPKKEEQDDYPIAYDTDNDLACTLLLLELRDLQEDIICLDGLFHEQMSISLDSKDKVKNVNTEEIKGHSASQDEATSELEKIKEELASLEQTYHGIWDQFVRIGCSIKSHNLLSPKEMMKKGYFSKWQDGVTRL